MENQPREQYFEQHSNQTEQLRAPSVPWRVVVHNDPINLMTYVQAIFESYFGLDPITAHSKMMEVHRHGRSVLASGPREQMERDAQAMHGYGLWATIEPEGEA
ncbi:MAG: ATP-dependent Clp protease adapter ClpS [Actinomycetaceae bacterium]|nr:ATP-dependent Clp protease adapter ClpS [Arcanobacterium sp.]MDD7504720.1 ATP-dependent Clp protease adapter ClpS [Actinomycetaceae bacterium]MDY6143105.1 ATP-dependent Clp protease adapter ClpS [Arcanobacterium sp.]